ncbi:MAG: hypothetical protein JO056_08145 [Alphaproteobacteria bacterium]|nr:hypothetical protein [Alphaproteobacteria bacterium]
MLLSLSRKFIFVANLKSASSSIEQALAPYAEFRVTKTEWGKHDTLTMISKKFPWVKRYVPYSDFFVFGVIREPVDFILSLYNFHTDDDFAGLIQSSKGVPFDEFWRGWCTRSWQTRDQHLRFVDKHENFRMNYLMDFAELKKEFPKICARIGVDAKLGQTNKSATVLSRKDLTPEQIAAIKERYAEDYALLANRPQEL